MGTNVNLTDILAKIASNADFLKSAGDNFKAGEKIEALFISGGDKGDTLVLRDTSGDQYSVSAQSVSGILTDAEFQALTGNGEVVDEAEVKDAIPVEVGTVDAADATDAVAGTQAVGDVANVAATGTSAEIQKEIEALQAQREANNQAMVSLQQQIEVLREKVEVSVKEAIAAMEDATEEQQEQADKIVQDKLAEFQADKAAGKNVTPEDLSNSVGAAIAAAGMPVGFSTAVSKLLFADTNMSIMNNLLDQLSSKIQVDKDLGKQIDTKGQALEAAKQAEEAAKAAEASSSKSCDPIGANFGEKLGFDLDGDGNAGQIQIDLFYDEDGDGQINSVEDFVGAKDKEDGWNEMTAMNTDGDDIISGDELKDKNVKVMITEVDADGTKTQRAMDVDEFTEQVGMGDLQISAAKHDQISQNVTGPFGFSDNTNNQMLGTFDISFKNATEDVSTVGYQTLDDIKWLNETYNIAGVNEAAEVGEAAEAGEVTEFEKFVNEYRETVMPELQKQIDDAYGELGFSKGLVVSIKNLATTVADLEAEKIAKEIDEKQEAQEAEAKKEAEEAQEAADDEADAGQATDALVVDDVADVAVPEAPTPDIQDDIFDIEEEVI